MRELAPASPWSRDAIMFLQARRRFRDPHRCIASAPFPLLLARRGVAITAFALAFSSCVGERPSRQSASRARLAVNAADLSFSLGPSRLQSSPHGTERFIDTRGQPAPKGDGMAALEIESKETRTLDQTLFWKGGDDEQTDSKDNKTDQSNNKTDQSNASGNGDDNDANNTDGQKEKNNEEQEGDAKPENQGTEDNRNSTNNNDGNDNNSSDTTPLDATTKGKNAPSVQNSPGVFYAQMEGDAKTVLTGDNDDNYKATPMTYAYMDVGFLTENPEGDSLEMTSMQIAFDRIYSQIDTDGAKYLFVAKCSNARNCENTTESARVMRQLSTVELKFGGQVPGDIDDDAKLKKGQNIRDTDHYWFGQKNLFPGIEFRDQINMNKGLCADERIVNTVADDGEKKADDNTEKKDIANPEGAGEGKEKGNESLLQLKQSVGRDEKDVRVFSMPLMWNGHASQQVCNEAIVDVLTCGSNPKTCPEPETLCRLCSRCKWDAEEQRCSPRVERDDEEAEDNTPPPSPAPGGGAAAQDKDQNQVGDEDSSLAQLTSEVPKDVEISSMVHPKGSSEQRRVTSQTSRLKRRKNYWSQAPQNISMLMQAAGIAVEHAPQRACEARDTFSNQASLVQQWSRQRTSAAQGMVAEHVVKTKARTNQDLTTVALARASRQPQEDEQVRPKQADEKQVQENLQQLERYNEEIMKKGQAKNAAEGEGESKQVDTKGKLAGAKEQEDKEDMRKSKQVDGKGERADAEERQGQMPHGESKQVDDKGDRAGVEERAGKEEASGETGDKATAASKASQSEEKTSKKDNQESEQVDVQGERAGAEERQGKTDSQESEQADVKGERAGAEERQGKEENIMREDAEHLKEVKEKNENRDNVEADDLKEERVKAQSKEDKQAVGKKARALEKEERRNASNERVEEAKQEAKALNGHAEAEKKQPEVKKLLAITVTNNIAISSEPPDVVFPIPTAPKLQDPCAKCPIRLEDWAVNKIYEQRDPAGNKQVGDLKETDFDKVDADGNGGIDEKEALQAGATPEEFRKADVDGSGNLNRYQWNSLVKGRQHKNHDSPESKENSAKSETEDDDDNEKGFDEITKEDFLKAGLTDEDFAEADKDKNGIITPQEWRAALAKKWGDGFMKEHDLEDKGESEQADNGTGERQGNENQGNGDGKAAKIDAEKGGGKGCDGNRDGEGCDKDLPIVLVDVQEEQYTYGLFSMSYTCNEQKTVITPLQFVLAVSQHRKSLKGAVFEEWMRDEERKDVRTFMERASDAIR